MTALLNRYLDLNTVQQCFRRFPLAMLAALGVIITIGKDTNDWQLAAWFLGMMFGSTAYSLYTEAGATHWRRHYALAGLCAWAGLLAITLWLSPHSPVSAPLLVASSVALLMLSPALAGQSSDRDLWAFNKILWTRIAFGTLLAALIFAGLGFILLSCNYLFGTDFPSWVYLYLWLCCAFLVTPLFVLNGLPHLQQLQPEALPRALALLINYCAVPLWLIVAVMLHCYIAMILAQQAWPKGGVVALTASFGLLGSILFLVNQQLKNHLPAISQWQLRLFPYLLIAPTMTMALALGVRISQYGLTETRLLLAMLSVFFAVLVALLLQQRLNPAAVSHLYRSMLAFVLAALMMLAFSATSLALHSQYGQLMALMQQYQLIDDNRLIAASRIILPGDAKALRDKMDFIVQRDPDGKLYELARPLLRQHYGNELSSNLTGHWLAEKLAVPANKYGGHGYFSLLFYQDKSAAEAIAVNGNIVVVDDNFTDGQPTKMAINHNNYAGWRLQIDRSGTISLFKTDSTAIYDSLDIRAKLPELKQKTNHIPRLASSNGKFQILLQNIAGNQDNDGFTELSAIRFILLLPNQ